MMRAPLVSDAWPAFGVADASNAQIGRDILLQVWFAVSMANGCRYCTMHQVVFFDGWASILPSFWRWKESTIPCRHESALRLCGP